MDLPALPIEPALPALLAGVRGARRVVLKAPPGAGKTTRVPEVLLDAGLPGSIVMLEPRRVAARAAARYLAQRRREQVGDTVGLQVRFERKASAKTRLMVVTEGILTRRMVHDPFLEGVSCVVLDEFHERSVHTDLALAFLRQTLEVRDDLAVVVMSATLDPVPVASFLDPAVVVETEGRAFPVDVTYTEGRDERWLEDRVASAVRSALREGSDEGQGHVLVFLPGAPEIGRTLDLLQSGGLPPDVEVLPLHGTLPTADQDRVLEPTRRRRVILATNIAETSLTIEGVRTVIDCGLEKRVRHDLRRAVDILDTVRISRFSAEQRAGRAGRTGPGRAVRLWSRAEDARLVEETEPEIARVDPAPVLLTLLAFASGDPRAFPLLTPLPPAHVERGLALLAQLGLVDTGAQRGVELTPMGRRAVDLPVHPREAVLLERADALGLLDRAALSAALLGERDVLAREPEHTADSDLDHRLDLIEEAEQERLAPAALRRLDLDRNRTRRVLEARDQLLRQHKRRRPEDGDHKDLVRALLAAYPDRVCVRRGEGSDRARMASGGGVRLHPSSGVRTAPMFLALDVGGAPDGRGDLLCRLAVRVERRDLEAELGRALITEERAVLDDDGRVRGRRVLRLGELVLEEKEGIAVGGEAIEAALVDAARADPARYLKLDEEADRLRVRMAYAARVWPDDDWPAADDDALLTLLPDRVSGMRTLADLGRIDWKSALLGLLGWERSRLLDREVPDRWTVPSGSQVKLDYSEAAKGTGPVILAVRMQEMFGSTSTPKVANRPVVLHLLAPNQRPAQITDDLGGFWERTWTEVKNELRRRYPKHSWPDDPAHAEPERRPQRRPR